MPTKKVAPAAAKARATADPEDAAVLALIAAAERATLARSVQVTARNEALSNLLHQWAYNIETDIDHDALTVLRAVAWTVTRGDAEGMKELGETALAVMTTKGSEAHRKLHRRVSTAVEVIAEHLRDRGNEEKSTDAQRAMLSVLGALAGEPDAFPITNANLDDAADRARRAAVRSALRDCAEKGTPRPMGPVLREWGCSEKTVDAALTNVRREIERRADRKK